MNRSGKRSVPVLIALLAGGIACAQKAPASPDRPWNVPPNQRAVAPARPTAVFAPDPAKIYTLPDLVNIAEQNNPDTRAAWENAKARAADLGVSKATLYPTLAALALAQTERIDLFFAPNYYRQTLAAFSPALVVDYVIFDFGRRSDEVAISRSNLLAADFFSTTPIAKLSSR